MTQRRADSHGRGAVAPGRGRIARSLGLFSATSRRDDEDLRLAPIRAEMLAEWSGDPWNFLTAKDTDGRPIVWTKDEGDDKQPYKPFPEDKPYLARLTRDLFSPEKIALVDKSRQMMVSTLCCLLLLHHIMFRRGRKVLLSKTKEDQSHMLMVDKMQGPYERMPEWLRVARPLTFTKSRIRCQVTDSMAMGVGMNAAASEFRGNQGSILMVDEAAFQEMFEDMIRAAEPMAARVWAITSANAGNPGGEYFRQMETED